MKNYIITVNGKTYDVSVEEKGASQAPAVSQSTSAAAPAASAPAPSPAGGKGRIKVTAPMSGKILGVKAAVGQAVQPGDVMVILEAMKMENEIVAPEAGTVASIDVKVGDAVESAQTLATLN